MARRELAARELQINGVNVHVSVIHGYIDGAIGTQAGEETARSSGAEQIAKARDTFGFSSCHWNAKNRFLHLVRVLVVQRVASRRPTKSGRKIRFGEDRPFMQFAIVKENLFFSGL